MYWRSSEGETREISREEMADIKGRGFSHTPVPNAISDTIYNMLKAEVAKVKAGEANVVEVKYDPQEAATKPILMTEDEAAKYPDAPVVKNGKVGDFLGYKPDFPTFFSPPSSEIPSSLL